MNNNKNSQYQDTISTRRVEDLISTVSRFVRLYQNIENARASNLGLTTTEFKFFRCFGKERYLTVKGLTECLGTVKSRVTRIIDGLTAKGLVKRFPDPRDKRVCLVGLTPAGQSKLSEVNNCCQEIFNQVLANADNQHQRDMIRLLDVLADHLEMLLQGELFAVSNSIHSNNS